MSSIVLVLKGEPDFGDLKVLVLETRVLLVLIVVVA